MTGSVWNICIHCVSCKSVFRTYHYDQGRPSSQCHRAMALVVFCPAPNFRAYIESPITKSLETPNWHWLISFPMGALDYDIIIMWLKITILFGLDFIVYNCCTRAPYKQFQILFFFAIKCVNSTFRPSNNLNKLLGDN